MAEAIKELRAHLKESQQQFALRVNIAPRSVARYEGDRPPKGTTRLRLADVAAEARRPDLQKVFLDAEHADVSSRLSPTAGAIRRLRAALGYTQQRLANEAGLTLGLIASAETRSAPGPAVIERLMLVARKHGLTDVEAQLLAAENLQSENRDWYRKNSRESAAELRYKVLDDIHSLPIFNHEEDVSPIDLTWLLSKVTSDERESFDRALVDLALATAKRLLAEQPHLKKELFRIEEKARRAEFLRSQGRPQQYHEMTLEQRQLEDLKPLLASLPDSVQPPFLGELIKLVGALRDCEPRLYAFSWLLGRWKSQTDSKELGDVDDFLIDHIQKIVRHEDCFLSEAEVRMLGSLGSEAVKNAKLIPDSLIENSGELAAMWVNRLFRYMEPAEAAKKLKISIDRLEALRTGAFELFHAEYYDLRRWYADELEKLFSIALVNPPTIRLDW